MKKNKETKNKIKKKNKKITRIGGSGHAGPESPFADWLEKVRDLGKKIGRTKKEIEKNKARIVCYRFVVLCCGGADEAAVEAQGACLTLSIFYRYFFSVKGYFYLLRLFLLKVLKKTFKTRFKRTFPKGPSRTKNSTG